MKKAVFCWSGGKDSALALYRVQQAGAYEVTALLTTLSSTYQRVSMHGIEEGLLELQAKAIGLPLVTVAVDEATNEAYEAGMLRALSTFKQDGVHYVIFGDIHLQDIRAYREQMLAHIGMQAVFPLWHMDTTRLLELFVAEGFKTITCCVNESMLDGSFAGRIIDQSFIDTLPTGIDPCGENGEYHTFCFDGPVFKQPVPLDIAGLVQRKIIHGTEEHSFRYADLRSAAPGNVL